MSWNLARIAKYAAISVGVYVAFNIGYIALLLWSSSGDPFVVDRFDEKAWLIAPTETEQITCYRGGMANDLKDRVLKAGMTRFDVEGLLGPPDAGSSTSAEYQYVLGMCSGLGWDFDVLHVHFTGDSKLERVAIIQH